MNTKKGKRMNDFGAVQSVCAWLEADLAAYAPRHTDILVTIYTEHDLSNAQSTILN